MKKKEKFLEILKTAVILFAIVSIIGMYHEQIRHLIRWYMKTGIIEWEGRTGLIYGPFCPIYGAGAVLIYLVFCFKERKWYQNLLLGALLGGILEYVASFLQEMLFGTISWDYSGYFLNIHGRTNVPYMLMWGILVVVFVNWIYPWFKKMYDKIPKKVTSWIAYPLLVFFIFDAIISFVAVYRQAKRHEGVEAANFIDRFCDEHYDDEFLKTRFTNARKPSWNKD